TARAEGRPPSAARTAVHHERRQRDGAGAARRAGRGRGALPDAGPVAAARGAPAIPVRAARGDVRGRIADADVRAHAPDVENCMRELVTFGVAAKAAGTG